MQTIQHPHPLASASAEVMDVIDALDPLLCTRTELQALIDTIDEAQDGVQVRGWLWGVLDTRTTLSLISGREF